MHPFALFLLAIFTPFGFCLTLFVLPYLGILSAAYIVYNTGAPVHPLANHLYDVFYIIDVYTKLFNNLMAHLTEVNLIQYTLPVIILPLAGIIGALWLTRKFVRAMGEVFHSGVGV